jgi:predicted permease
MFATILLTLVPVFGLILVGFACAGRLGLSEHGFEILNRFVISLALPALTFRTIAHMRAVDLAQPSMLVALIGGALAIYAVSFALERELGRSAAHANIVALASCYSNTAFIGLPIAIIVFGPAALGPVTLAGAVYAAVIFGAGVLVGEVSGSQQSSRLAGVQAAMRAVSRNPLIIGAVAGIAWAILGLPLSGPVDMLLETLAAATPACALISIGLFIARKNPPAAHAVTARIVIFKLLVHPLVTLVLISLLPPMPPLWAKVAVLMAAMPTGTSSFVLAGNAGQWALQTSARAIILTVLFSAVSLLGVGWFLLAHAL